MSDEKYRDIFSKKLNYYMKKNGKIQQDLIDDLGLSSSTISSWATGVRLPRMGKVQMLADYFGIEKSDLLEDNENYEDKYLYLNGNDFYPLKKKKYPVIGTIACGQPLLASENIGYYIESSDDLNADFCLKCKGDSMVDAGIKEGDVVFVRQQPDVESGEIAAVLIDDEATLKRVNKSVPGFILLEAANPRYQPIVLDLKDESISIRIIGKAIGMQRMFGL